MSYIVPKTALSTPTYSMSGTPPTNDFAGNLRAVLYTAEDLTNGEIFNFGGGLRIVHTDGFFDFQGGFVNSNVVSRADTFILSFDEITASQLVIFNGTACDLHNLIGYNTVLSSVAQDAILSNPSRSDISTEVKFTLGKGHNTWVSEIGSFALNMVDQTLFNAPVNHTEQFIQRGITSNSKLLESPTAIPVGYKIIDILIEETNGVSLTVNLGYSTGGTHEVLSSEDIPANGEIPMKPIRSYTPGFTSSELHLSSPSFGGASLDITITMQKVK